MRAAQVAERGLRFVAAFRGMMEAARLPALLCEAWAFSACLSLAMTLARLAPGAPALPPGAAVSPAVGSSPFKPDAGCARKPLISQMDGFNRRPCPFRRLKTLLCIPFAVR